MREVSEERKGERLYIRGIGVWRRDEVKESEPLLHVSALTFNGRAMLLTLKKRYNFPAF